MAEPAPSTSFWRTIPGLLTAVAGIVTAITGLVVALSQAGLLPRRAGPAADTASADSSAVRHAEIAGRWSGRVTYPWGAAYDEGFRFQVEDGRVLGAASYLGMARAIEDGRIDGTRLTFATRVEEVEVGGRRTYQNLYDGRVTPRGIQFHLRDTRGGEPVDFLVVRAP